MGNFSKIFLIKKFLQLLLGLWRSIKVKRSPSFQIVISNLLNYVVVGIGVW